MSVLASLTSHNWQEQKLGTLFERVQQVGFPELQPLSVFLGDGVIPRSAREDNHNQLGADLSKYQRVQPADIVFNKLRTWQGGFGVSAHEGIVSPAYIVCRPRTAGMEPRFVHHLLRSAPYLAELTRLSKWMPPSQFDISWDEIRTLPLLLPSLYQQRRIADFLDDQVSRIDNVIAARERQLSLLSEQRDTLTDVVFASCEATSVIPLRRVVDRWIDYRGATPIKTDSGVPLVTARNIRDGQVIVEGAEEFISENDYDAWMRRGLPEVGDVLLTTEAPLGQVAQIIETKIALAQRIILLRPNCSRVYPRWLYWYLRSPCGSREMWMRATGTTAPGIKAERLRDVPIPVPPLETQRRQLPAVDEVDHATRGSRAVLSNSVERFRELKRSLITAAVTGEFDVSSADGSQVPA